MLNVTAKIRVSKSVRHGACLPPIGLVLSHAGENARAVARSTLQRPSHGPVCCLMDSEPGSRLTRMQ